MILSFGDTTTEDLFHGYQTARVRRIGPEVQVIALRKLDMIAAAQQLSDLRVPPGNRLEPLKGDRAGFHSIRINDQWRIVFKWENGGATEVSMVDYH